MCVWEFCYCVEVFSEKTFRTLINYMLNVKRVKRYVDFFSSSLNSTVLACSLTHLCTFPSFDLRLAVLVLMVSSKQSVATVVDAMADFSHCHTTPSPSVSTHHQCVEGDKGKIQSLPHWSTIVIMFTYTHSTRFAWTRTFFLHISRKKDKNNYSPCFSWHLTIEFNLKCNLHQLLSLNKTFSNVIACTCLVCECKV